MKRIVSLLTAVVLLFSLTACSGGNSSSESSASGGSSASDSSSADNSGSSDASLPEGEDITLSFLRLGNDEAERVFWEEVIASYESEHPGVKIEYDDAPIGDDMDLKLTSLFTANAGPDIIGHGILSVASRVEAGYYLPITQYYENWEGKDDMFPQLVDLGTYNGEVYQL